MIRENLIKLGQFLYANVKDDGFDMGNFRSYRDEYGELEPMFMYCNVPLHECGTVGCALGYAPFHPDLKIIDGDMHYDHTLDWNKYCQRVMGFNERSPLWDFIFSSYWDEVDNTRLGAVRRIIFLTSGKLDPDPLCPAWRRNFIYQSEVPDASVIMEMS